MIDIANVLLKENDPGLQKQLVSGVWMMNGHTQTALCGS